MFQCPNVQCPVGYVELYLIKVAMGSPMSQRPMSNVRLGYVEPYLIKLPSTDFGLWTLDLWTLDRTWTLDFGHWTLDFAVLD